MDGCFQITKRKVSINYHAINLANCGSTVALLVSKVARDRSDLWKYSLVDVDIDVDVQVYSMSTSTFVRHALTVEIYVVYADWYAWCVELYSISSFITEDPVSLKTNPADQDHRYISGLFLCWFCIGPRLSLSFTLILGRGSCCICIRPWWPLTRHEEATLWRIQV